MVLEFNLRVKVLTTLFVLLCGISVKVLALNCLFCPRGVNILTVLYISKPFIVAGVWCVNN